MSEVKEPLQSLNDAAELLAMLEYMTEGLAKEFAQGVVPWGGITLTIRNSRELIARAQDSFSREQFVESAPFSMRAELGRGASLAERVQQIPVGGSRARELVGNPNSQSNNAKSARPPITSGKVAVNEMPE